jgi:hypothetical protein
MISTTAPSDDSCVKSAADATASAPTMSSIATPWYSSVIEAPT